jgi:hypothetical protein
MRSKKVRERKSSKKTVTSTTKLKYEPDNFDIFLLNALKEKIGRNESGIIQIALMQLYIELHKDTYQNYIPGYIPPSYIPGYQGQPQWETDIKITCGDESQANQAYKSTDVIRKIPAF